MDFLNYLQLLTQPQQPSFDSMGLLGMLQQPQQIDINQLMAMQNMNPINNMLQLPPPPPLPMGNQGLGGSNLGQFNQVPMGMGNVPVQLPQPPIPPTTGMQMQQPVEQIPAMYGAGEMQSAPNIPNPEINVRPDQMINPQQLSSNQLPRGYESYNMLMLNPGGEGMEQQRFSNMNSNNIMRQNAFKNNFSDKLRRA